jgi:hypothetical protein
MIDSVFIKALALFVRTTVALTHFDIMVPYWYVALVTYYCYCPTHIKSLTVRYAVVAARPHCSITTHTLLPVAAQTASQWLVAAASPKNTEHSSRSSCLQCLRSIGIPRKVMRMVTATMRRAATRKSMLSRYKPTRSPPLRAQAVICLQQTAPMQ